MFHEDRNNPYYDVSYYKFIDLKWNISLSINPMAVYLYASEFVYQNASGLLMEGCDHWVNKRQKFT